ncbi:MAG: hypothetical protein QM698_05945 [Micropepsaceae bacterium]
MEFLLGANAPAFALTAAFAGAFAAVGLARDAQRRISAGSGREAFIAPLGLLALGAAFAAGAGTALRLMAGALLLTGLALMALASRRERAGPARQIGLVLAWTSIAVALAGAFLPAASAPDSPV